MGLQQFERRLERMVEGVFARAFRGGLQPVEIGRRLTREMDLRRTVAPKGTLAPNDFVVVLSPPDRARFASIEDELVEELIAVARDHADIERYSFVGPLSVEMETDPQLSPGMVLVSGEMQRGEGTALRSRLVLPDGRPIPLSDQVVTIGRLPDCTIVLADPNVSRVHAEVRPIGDRSGVPEYAVVDRGSTNGTRVNGAPVTGSRPLAAGDTITLGATSIAFEQA
jgi:hypothetical protein